MKVNKRYPTASTIDDFEITTNIDAIQNPLPNIGEGYYMGYVKYDDFPKCDGLTLCEHPDPDTDYTLTWAPVKQNYNWGFIHQHYNSSDLNSYTVLYYYNQDNTIGRTSTAYYSYNGVCHFINSMVAAKLTWADGITIQCAYQFIRNDCYDFNGDGSNFNPDNSGDTSANLYNVETFTLTLTYAQIYDVVNNRGTLYTITDTVNGNQAIVPIKLADFNEYNLVVKDLGNGYSLCFIIMGYYKNGTAKYDSSQLQGGTQNVTPFYGVSIPEGVKQNAIPEQNNAILAACGSFNSYMNIQFRNSPYWGQSKFYSLATNNNLTRNLLYGCFPYDEFNSQEAINEIIHNPGGGADYGMGYNRSGIYKKKIFIRFNTGTSNILEYRFYQQINPRDILKVLQMFNKMEIDVDDINEVVGTDTYTEDHTTALFNEDETPKPERIVGDYDDIASDLRYWQRVDIPITIDTYDPADLPPYDPNPDAGEEDGGEDIYFNTNIPMGISSFITNYAMSPTQVGILGQQVWTKVLNASTSDMIKNFFLFDSSFDPSSDKYDLIAANILDYFISLKYFPFDIGTVVGGDDATSIYVGTGTEAINLGSVAKKLGSQMAILDGGEVKLPDGYTKITGVEGAFESFLDHEPHTAVSIYVPFCGTVSLPPSVVMGSTLNLQYCVDMNTGGCMAIISKVGKKRFPIAVINGTVGFEVMLTGNNAQTVQANANNALCNYTLEAGRSMVGLLETGIGGLTGAQSSSGTAGGIIGGATDMVFNSAKFATNLPKMMATQPLAVGTNSTLAALMTPLTAYVQIRRHTAQTDNFDLIGYTLDELNVVASANGMGFIQMINPNLDGLSCTQKEAEMIRQLLTQGIWT